MTWKESQSHNETGFINCGKYFIYHTQLFLHSDLIQIFGLFEILKKSPNNKTPFLKTLTSTTN